MKKLLQKSNTGFTLVETLVAISIFSVSILGMMSVLASGVSSTNYAKQKIIAGYLAQEGIEYIRNMRDTFVLYTDGEDWDSFKGRLDICNSGDKCGFDTIEYVYSFDSVQVIQKCSDSLYLNICKVYLDDGSYYTDANYDGTDSGFFRKIWMEAGGGLGGDEVKVFSEVSWTQGSGEHKIILSENLFNFVES